MLGFNAREELPIYASTATGEWPKFNTFPNSEAGFKAAKKLSAMRLKETLVKRYGIAILAMFALFIWTAVTCGVTYYFTKQYVTEELTHEWRGIMQHYTEEMNNRHTAESLLTGDASLEAQIAEEEAPYLAALRRAYIENGTPEADADAICWEALIRVDSKSKLYPNTVKGVVEQPKQWMFLNVNRLRYNDSDIEAVTEMLRQWHKGQYPAGLDVTYEWAEWDGGTVILRNTYDKTSKTKYWRLSK